MPCSTSQLAGRLARGRQAQQDAARLVRPCQQVPRTALTANRSELQLASSMDYSTDSWFWTFITGAHNVPISGADARQAR